MTRKILVILSNRLSRGQKLKYLELDANDKGEILKEKKLTRAPTGPAYHEVWENDEGRTEFASCNRFKRKYGHKLQKAAP